MAAVGDGAVGAAALLVREVQVVPGLQDGQDRQDGRLVVGVRQWGSDRGAE
ncbi:hypothetical protein ABZ614_34765 [Streptomyces sp. NPDC013178]|uniref:hypothetical protein n=1 Tax=Streptomyces sp. NPDC013178 TaxID=3155118 RepID=UPI0033F3BC14